MPIIKNKNRIKITVQQDDWDCGPASLRMYLSYYGYNFTKAKLARETQTTKDGTDSPNIVEFLRSLDDYDVLEYENNYKMAKKYLKENTPLFICYDMFGNPKYSHYAVCIGMTKRKILLLNPYTNKKEEVAEEYDMAWFNQWWDKTKQWFLVLKRK